MEENKTIDFEKSLNRLDEIAKAIESANLPLEETISLFEEGSRIIKELETSLKNAEERIAQVINITK